ncbi:ATP-binding protein [Candidatus Peribacteria bacterium]|nr:ATP-binding protein [Candidatus Peribacteria bacterium]
MGARVQFVEELLTNAMDFSPDRAEIIVRLRKDGTTACLEVQDFGCGIPTRDLSRVCDEFARGSNATRFKADGNGLGLYIVKGVVTRAGGKVSIASHEAKGTTVTVRLPIV